MRGMAREKGIKALAWISYGFAVLGGAAIAGTFIGSWLANIIGVFPGWVATALFAGAFVAMAVDLVVDATPNQLALYCAILLPSLARAVPGKLSDTVINASNNVLAALTRGLGEWLGTTSAIGIAVACVAVSLLVGRRVLVKGGR